MYDFDGHSVPKSLAMQREYILEYSLNTESYEKCRKSLEGDILAELGKVIKSIHQKNNIEQRQTQAKEFLQNFSERHSKN
jgi:hypothetical protein